MNSKKIIEAVGNDPRIGTDYCNPSFGYGGYCLPKDTKQLHHNYTENNIPQRMIEATVEANDLRKQHVANMLLARKPKCVGVYRLTMKKDSDNFRESAVQDIIRILEGEGVKVVIYEPTLEADTFAGCEVIKDFETFANESDIILANRKHKRLEAVMDKVYTRDIMGKD